MVSKQNLYLAPRWSAHRKGFRFYVCPALEYSPIVTKVEYLVSRVFKSAHKNRISLMLKSQTRHRPISDEPCGLEVPPIFR